jgi:predicted ribosome-associated RNA-binding protein Tma20
MSSATVSSAVSGAHVMIPGVMTSATDALRNEGRK